MTRTLGLPLLRIARGTGIILVGTFVAQFLGILSRIFIARNFSVYEFGLLSLGLSIIALVSPLAKMGLPAGSTRYIAVYKSDKDPSNLRGVIATSLVLTTIASLIIGGSLFFFANSLSQFMSIPDFVPIIRILSFLIPFSVLSTLIIAFSRGFNRVKEAFWFDSIMPNTLKISSVIIILLLHGPILWIVWAYFLVSFAEALVLLIYSRGQLPKLIPSSPIQWNVGKKLLIFSLPLLGVSLVNSFGSRIDIVLLGYFLSPNEVGLYSVSILLASIVPILHSAMTFLFLPVSSQLAAENRVNEFKTLYSTVSKWMTLFSYPIFALFLIVPSLILTSLFGQNYIEATRALQILTFAQFFHVLVGPNGMALTALGNTKEIFRGGAIGALLSSVLNLLLIPFFGLEGAAVASSTALIISNIYISYRLYQTAQVLSLSKGYFKMVTILVITVLLGMLLEIHITTMGIFVIPALLLILTIVSMGCVIVSGCISDADREFYRAVLNHIKNR